MVQMSETDKAARAISKARANLILTNPFYAALALRLEAIPAPIGTICTDGRSLWFDPAWINAQKPDHLVTIIAPARTSEYEVLEIRFEG